MTFEKSIGRYFSFFICLKVGLLSLLLIQIERLSRRCSLSSISEMMTRLSCCPFECVGDIIECRSDICIQRKRKKIFYFYFMLFSFWLCLTEGGRNWVKKIGHSSSQKIQFLPSFLSFFHQAPLLPFPKQRTIVDCEFIVLQRHLLSISCKGYLYH